MTGSTVLPPVDPPKSFAQVYALEAQYQAIESEYKTLMRRLNHTCVGKAAASTECVKAAQLNADMQTTLADLSSTLKETGAPKKTTSVIAQQKKLPELADGLENAKLTATQQDATVTTNMYKSHYLAWALGVAFLVALVWSRRGRAV